MESRTQTHACHRCALPLLDDTSQCPWCGRAVRLGTERHQRRASALALVALGLSVLAVSLVALLAVL